MTLFRGYGFFASSLSGAAPGMVLMKPTSIANSGGSATLGANGQVTFSGINSVSLNGVFTSDFDNYMISIRHSSGGNPSVDMRLRASGSDASATNYVFEQLQANNTAVAAFRETSQSAFRIGLSSSTLRSGDTVMVYGPALAQPTATRNVNVRGINNAQLHDCANTHSLSTAYDGCTILADLGSETLTGAVQVYGLRS